MPKLKNKCKKGVGLIEVLCSMAVLLILTSYVFTSRLNVLKVSKENRQLNGYVELLSSLKKNMYFNCTYDDIMELIKDDRLYIDKSNLSVKNLKENKLQVFTKSNTNEKPYLKMDIENHGEVLKLELNLYVDVNKKNKVLKAVCYKGAY